ncbi:MAG TPA: alkaline phosphatase family protein [Candidatus Cloacimonadota bacterium]|nr:alkaline phosphatase family protein [Candidatus Cloacimonadota bacterium]
MKPEIMLPDYRNSIVNLTASILTAFGVSPHHPPLEQLTLPQENRNIVLFILDGFGYNLYCKYAAETFLAKHFVSTLTSVFPPTTSAAVTSLTTGRTPLEHGAIGWTLFFKEFAKNIDYLPNWDSITATAQSPFKYNVYDIVGAESIFVPIAQNNPEALLYQITDKHLQNSFNVMRTSANSTVMSPTPDEDRYDLICKVIKQHPQIRKFIYSYSPSPDHEEHKHGVFSAEVEMFLRDTFQKLENLCAKLAGTDTSIIISADHGLLDIGEYYYLNEDKELFESVILPAFPEPRFISFFVKRHREKQFLQAAQKYEEDFWILPRTDFMGSHLLGMGMEHPKIDDFVGDYLFIAKSDKAMRYIYQQNGKWNEEFKAHHAGITPAEMEIPLIHIIV